jgi:hypothetical protein
MKPRSTCAAAVIAVVLTVTLASQAQWVAVARAVSGRSNKWSRKTPMAPAVTMSLLW